MATSDGRPETVYELCEMTCEAIETQPLNYIQTRWQADAKFLGNEACGTAYCRAGWMAILLQNNKRGCLNNSDIHRIASAVLKGASVCGSDIRALFDGSAIHRAGCDARQGTPEYVATGIQGMRNFMSKYEQKLKHARINPDNTITLLEGHPDYANPAEAKAS